MAGKFRKIDIVFRSLTLRFNLGARKACASNDAAMEMGWLILLFDLIGNLPGGGSGGGELAFLRVCCSILSIHPHPPKYS